MTSDCHVGCFCSVVVITFALHAKSPQFETGQKQCVCDEFELTDSLTTA